MLAVNKEGKRRQKRVEFQSGSVAEQPKLHPLQSEQQMGARIMPIWIPPIAARILRAYLVFGANRLHLNGNGTAMRECTVTEVVEQ